MVLTMSNLDTAKHCYELFAKGDIETLTRDFMAPDVTWTEPEVPGLRGAGTHHGPEAVAREVFGTIEETFGQGFKIHPGRWTESDDRVVLEGRFSGRLRGKDYELPFCHVLAIEDGRLTDFRNYTNTWALKHLHEP